MKQRTIRHAVAWKGINWFQTRVADYEAAALVSVLFCLDLLAAIVDRIYSSVGNTELTQLVIPHFPPFIVSIISGETSILYQYWDPDCLTWQS